MTTLDQTSAYKNLTQVTPPNLTTCLTPERIKTFSCHHKPLSFYYGTSLVKQETIDTLQALANELAIIKSYKNLLAGEKTNTSENRAVSHHKTRSQSKGIYGIEQRRFSEFAAKIHTQKLVSPNGLPYTDVVQIGIGGSSLGPHAIVDALDTTHATKLRPHFISNVDPYDVLTCLRHVPLETTLFIVVSKSGTTLETKLNYEFITKIATEKNLSSIDKQTIIITSKNSPLDTPNTLAKFYIDDAIGGRFSLTSAVGGVIISLCFGQNIFDDFLDGAHDIDKISESPDITQNPCLLSALIGLYERNILGYPTKAIIPYSHALKLFPQHIKQLDCESNGKSVTKNNTAIEYATGPLIVDGVGTNAQHAFFQLLHQGSDIIPVQFIGTKQDHIVNQNLASQMIALAQGQTNSSPNKTFTGNRPSSLILVDKISPYTLGALLAFYENHVMFQGFLWGINSFDQEGVELGKKLTTTLQNNTADETLNALFKEITS